MSNYPEMTCVVSVTRTYLATGFTASAKYSADHKFICRLLVKVKPCHVVFFSEEGYGSETRLYVCVGCCGCFIGLPLVPCLCANQVLRFLKVLPFNDTGRDKWKKSYERIMFCFVRILSRRKDQERGTCRSKRKCVTRCVSVGTVDAALLCQRRAW